MSQWTIYFIDTSLEAMWGGIVLCVAAMILERASGGDVVVRFSTMELRNYCTSTTSLIHGSMFIDGTTLLGSIEQTNMYDETELQDILNGCSPTIVNESNDDVFTVNNQTKQFQFSFLFSILPSESSRVESIPCPLMAMHHILCLLMVTLTFVIDSEAEAIFNALTAVCTYRQMYCPSFT